MTEYACVEAGTDGLLREVLRLRAECYSADLGRSIPAEADRYDAQENCQSYLLIRAGETAGLGSIRPCLFRAERPELQVPVSELYGEEMVQALGPDRSFVQSTQFVVSSSLGGGDMVPRLLLFREVFQTAVRNGVSDIVTLVRNRESYLRFYGRLGFRPIASGKSHGPYNVPTVLLLCEFSAAWFSKLQASPRLSPVLGNITFDALTLAPRFQSASAQEPA